MTSKKFSTSSKNLEKSPLRKSLEEMKQARRRARGNAFLKPIITLTTRGIGRTFDVFPEGL